MQSTQTITHDALARIVAAQSGASIPQTWAYDPDGNITSTVNGGITTTDTYSPTYNPTSPSTTTPELLSTTQSGGGSLGTYYSYDQSGNTTRITTTAGLSESLTYDAQGRLSSVAAGSGANTTTLSQTYNALGQRATYTLVKPGGYTQAQTYTYWAGQLGRRVVVSDTLSGQTTYTDTFIYDQAGLPLELIRAIGGGGTSRYWYVLDGRDNVVALIDSTGNVVDRYSYDLWGKVLTAQETVAQPYLYGGYWYDRELGWYWLAVRHYDPTLERFLQPDPSLSEGTRSYIYAQDDP